MSESCENVQKTYINISKTIDNDEKVRYYY